VSVAQTRVTGTVRLTASLPVACFPLPPILPMLRIAAIAVWLAVHREMRTRPRWGALAPRSHCPTPTSWRVQTRARANAGLKKYLAGRTALAQTIPNP